MGVYRSNVITQSYGGGGHHLLPPITTNGPCSVSEINKPFISVIQSVQKKPNNTVVFAFLFIISDLSIYTYLYEREREREGERDRYTCTYMSRYCFFTSKFIGKRFLVKRLRRTISPSSLSSCCRKAPWGRCLEGEEGRFSLR